MSDSVRPEAAAIPLGLTGTADFIVDDTMLAKQVGGRGVLATPAMIGLMEKVSNEAIKGRLPAGYVSVGYEVHVFHLAPAPFESTVTVTATVDEVEGRKVRFNVECRLADTTVGKGAHTRAVIKPHPAPAG